MRIWRDVYWTTADTKDGGACTSKEKRKNTNKDTGAAVVELLSNTAPDRAVKMDEAVDVVHRAGRKMENIDKSLFYFRDEKRETTSGGWQKLLQPAKETRFAEGLTQEDWRSRQAPWPKTDQRGKEGKAAGFRGPLGFIEDKCIMGETSAVGWNLNLEWTRHGSLLKMKWNF